MLFQRLALHPPDRNEFSGLISSGSVRSADEVNATFPQGYFPPFTPGTQVREFVADGTQNFVRVFTDDRQMGGWVMRASDIAGLSPSEIADRFALPEVPTHVTSVTPPQGTRIRTGSVNTNFGRPGGGIQFQLLENVPRDRWGNVEALK